jgi:hypothetical protein
MLVQLATNRLDGSGNQPDDSQTLSAVIGVFQSVAGSKKRSDTSAKVLAERAPWQCQLEDWKRMTTDGQLAQPVSTCPQECGAHEK